MSLPLSLLTVSNGYPNRISLITVPRLGCRTFQPAFRGEVHDNDGTGQPVLRGSEPHPGTAAKAAQRLRYLILDELGYVPFSKTGAELLFDVVSRAY